MSNTIHTECFATMKNCPVCGSAMTNTTGGNYHCTNPSCDYAENDLVRRINLTPNIATPYTPENSKPNPLSMGWICPICGRALSPTTSECPCYLSKHTINSNYTASVANETPVPNDSYQLSLFRGDINTDNQDVTPLVAMGSLTADGPVFK